jgi:hypothetical protein
MNDETVWSNENDVWKAHTAPWFNAEHERPLTVSDVERVGSIAEFESEFPTLAELEGDSGHA